MVAFTLASTGESFLIGGREAPQVGNRYEVATGGSYYPALPSILSSPNKQDEHNVSSAFDACHRIHLDEIAWRTAIRHDRHPSRTVIQYHEHIGKPPYPRLSDPEVLD